MLKFLRDHANSWIMKILLGILILSFGLFWGVSEFFRGNDKNHIVASIGKLEISKQHLMQSVQEELTKLNKELKGKNVSFTQALQFGLVAQNLNRIVHEIVLDMFMKDMKISVSNKVIGSLIYADPLFQSAQGSFDKEKFRQILEVNRLTEKSFFANRNRALSQMQILTAISVGSHSPAALSYPVFQALTQKCSFRVATLLGEKIQVSYTENELKKFYKEHSNQFRSPEYRDFKLILLDPNHIALHIPISESEVQQFYNDQKENYSAPETRSFSLINCKNQEEASLFKRKLKAGQMIDKARQKNYESVAELNLNKVLGSIVFNLSQGDISDPFTLHNQLFLVRLNHISPAKVVPIGDVRSQIVADLKRQKALDEISKISEKIEEGTNQGLSLEEIAKKNRLTVQEGRIDRSGDFVGNATVNLSQDIVKDIFSLSEGAETQLTELPDGVSYLVSVDKVFPAHLEEFEKIRFHISKAFIQEKRQQALKSLAQTVQEKMQKGEPVNNPLVSFVETPKISVAEGVNKGKVPLPVIQRGFSLAKGQADIVMYGDRVYVVSPLSIESVPIEKNLALYKAYREDLGKSIVQSMSFGVIESLKKEYKVQVHPSVIASLKE